MSGCSCYRIGPDGWSGKLVVYRQLQLSVMNSVRLGRFDWSFRMPLRIGQHRRHTTAISTGSNTLQAACNFPASSLQPACRLRNPAPEGAAASAYVRPEQCKSPRCGYVIQQPSQNWHRLWEAKGMQQNYEEAAAGGFRSANGQEPFPACSVCSFRGGGVSSRSANPNRLRALARSFILIPPPPPPSSNEHNGRRGFASADCVLDRPKKP